MVFTALEIISLIFVILGLIKLLFVVINKKIWLNNIVKPFYKNSGISSLILAILAIIIFYFLIQELNIVQIFAVIAFSSLLIALGFLRFSKDMSKIIEKAYNKRLDLGSLLYIALWLALLLWALYSIFK